MGALELMDAISIADKFDAYLKEIKEKSQVEILSQKTKVTDEQDKYNYFPFSQ